MILRLSKCSLILAVGLYFLLVVFNNITDYESNHHFVQHVLSMDSTFPGNKGMGRAIVNPAIHTAFYLSIIAWESIAALLCLTGAVLLLRQLDATPRGFRDTQSVAIAGLTLGALLFLVAFVDVGGEWFLMWQSHTWNGLDTAFRSFTIIVLTLLYLTFPEPD